MPDSPEMSAQENQTDRFLKTDGPPPGYFTPDVPEYALEGATKRERYILEMQSIQAKQNQYLIEQNAGHKTVLRTVIDRLKVGDAMFVEINKDRADFKAWIAKWLSRKNVIRNLFAVLATAIILPLLVLLADDWLKHIFHWQ
jgi:hypothetical protein